MSNGLNRREVIRRSAQLLWFVPVTAYACARDVHAQRLARVSSYGAADVQGYVAGNPDDREDFMRIPGADVDAGEAIELTIRDLFGHDVPVGAADMQALKNGKMVEVWSTTNGHEGEPQPHRHQIVFDPKIKPNLL